MKTLEDILILHFAPSKEELTDTELDTIYEKLIDVIYDVGELIGDSHTDAIIKRLDGIANQKY